MYAYIAWAPTPCTPRVSLYAQSHVFKETIYKIVLVGHGASGEAMKMNTLALIGHFGTW